MLTWGGWLTCAGWQAAITTAAFFTGTLIQGMVVENDSGYIFQRWHGTLITWAAIFLAVGFNTILIRVLPKVEGTVLVLHILGFVAILIPLIYLAPHSAPSEVFSVFLNAGGWSSQGLSFFIGLVGNATAFLGKSQISVRRYLKTNLMKVPMEQSMYVIQVTSPSPCEQYHKSLENTRLLRTGRNDV